MKGPHNPSRRSFLANASGAAGTGWLALQWPAYLAAASAGCSRRNAEQDFANIDQEMGNALEAIAEQIIPSDQNSAGARSAGVIWFIDQWLGAGGKRMIPMLREGVGSLDSGAGGPGQFIKLSFDQQTEALQEIQNGGFFSAVRFLTIVGMFAMPDHGGNQEQAGWKLIGFRDQHAWQAPFGFYDGAASVAENNEGDASA
ncbi:MAG TPA: gluconate 2-dehydrogenase subunit 3 family protein [Xanthomonadales bacterium]|nr:gluconate 2-dehydrogenase subunit 3 family protein [Xanthomonadales bacterium]